MFFWKHELIVIKYTARSQIKRNQLRFLYSTTMYCNKLKTYFIQKKTTFPSTLSYFSLKEGAKKLYFFLSLHNLISKILEQGLLIFFKKFVDENSCIWGKNKSVQVTKQALSNYLYWKSYQNIDKSTANIWNDSSKKYCLSLILLVLRH